jgi:hypothetical protein
MPYLLRVQAAAARLSSLRAVSEPERFYVLLRIAGA